MAKPLNIDAVGAALGRLIEHENIPLAVQDGDGAPFAISPLSADDRAGLLPVFLVAGEAVWREATGQRFGLVIEQDPKALLGYRVVEAGEVPLTIAMLAILEAIERARDGKATLQIERLVSVAIGATANAKAMLPPPAPAADLRPRLR